MIQNRPQAFDYTEKPFLTVIVLSNRASPDTIAFQIYDMSRKGKLS